MFDHKENITRWLRILFDIQIAAMVITAVNAVSDLDSITKWLSKGLSVASIWCFFQLRDAHPRYQTTAIAQAVVLICGLITLPVNTSGMGPATVLLLVGATASWIAAYQEYHAHGELVAEADEILAKKWNGLFGLEILIGIGISIVSTVATTILVSSGAISDAKTVATIVLILSTGLGLVTKGLYLLYMKRTRKLLEA